MNEQKAKKHPETKNHCKRHVFRHCTSDESESSDPSNFVTSFVPVWDFTKHVTLHGFWISALFAKKNAKTQHSKRKGKYRTPWFNSLEDQDSSQFWNWERRQRTNEWWVKNWGSFWNMMNLSRPQASASALVPKIGSSVGSVVNFKICLFTLWSFDWELHGPLTFPFIVYGRKQNKDYFIISQRMSIYILNYNTLWA